MKDHFGGKTVGKSLQLKREKQQKIWDFFSQICISFDSLFGIKNNVFVIELYTVIYGVIVIVGCYFLHSAFLTFPIDNRESDLNFDSELPKRNHEQTFLNEIMENIQKNDVA